MNPFDDERLARVGGLLPVVATVVLLLIMGRAAGADASLNWQPGPGCRWRELAVPAAGRTGFTLLPPQTTGISFTNFITDERSVTNQNLLNGSGVALGDVDGDGLCDVYLCRLDGNNNKLFRNLGNWKLEDITDSPGAGCGGKNWTGPVLADIRGDAEQDLLLDSMAAGTSVCEK